MKIIRPLTIGIVFSFFYSSITFSQTNLIWEPIYLTVTGHNMVEGVEAFFQSGECDGEKVVFVKFLNHNTQSVKIEWYDGVFTRDLKWINRESASDKKTLTIDGNKEAKGECANSGNTYLTIKLSDFVKDPNNFKRYAASNLEISLL